MNLRSERRGTRPLCGSEGPNANKMGFIFLFFLFLGTGQAWQAKIWQGWVGGLGRRIRILAQASMLDQLCLIRILKHSKKIHSRD